MEASRVFRKCVHGKTRLSFGRQPVAVVVGSRELKVHSGWLAIGCLVLQLEIGDRNFAVNNGEGVLLGDLLSALIADRFWEGIDLGKLAVHRLLEFEIENYALNLNGIMGKATT